MTETVKIWIDEFKARGKDFNEEIEDIKGTIANERLWQKGVETKEQVDMHEENIAELTEYLEWLEENKDKKSGNFIDEDKEDYDR